jgi:putative membrane protein
MTSRLTQLVSASALALALSHCGGGSTPESKTPASPDAKPEAVGEQPVAPAKPSSTAQATEPSDTSPLKLTDAQIAAVTDSVNTAEIEQARLAQSKSKNAQVQSFAAMMIEHHGEAKRKQTALNLGEAESAVSLRVAASTHITMEQLKQKEGSEFDQAYLQAQIDGHQKVLDAIDRELLPSAKDPALKAYLYEIRPKVEQHLEQAQQAKQTLASARSTSSPHATNQ